MGEDWFMAFLGILCHISSSFIVGKDFTDRQSNK